jgi:hypothetical protein
MTTKQRARKQGQRIHDAARGSHRRGKRPWPSDRHAVERDQRRLKRREVRGVQATLTINDELRSLMPSQIQIRDHKQAAPNYRAIRMDRQVRERKAKAWREDKL